MSRNILHEINGRRFYCSSKEVKENDPNTYDGLIESFPDEDASNLEQGKYVVEYYFGNGVLGIRAAEDRGYLIRQDGFFQHLTGYNGLKYEDVSVSNNVLEWYKKMAQINGEEI